MLRACNCGDVASGRRARRAGGCLEHFRRSAITRAHSISIGRQAPAARARVFTAPRFRNTTTATVRTYWCAAPVRSAPARAAPISNLACRHTRRVSAASATRMSQFRVHAQHHGRLHLIPCAEAMWRDLHDLALRSVAARRRKMALRSDAAY